MGRQEEPSQEELEFIFGCMDRGLSTAEILYEIEDTEFPKRGREFISRKRKCFDAAKTVLGEHVESKHDPLIVEARRQHFLDIEKIGRALVAELNGAESSGDTDVVARHESLCDQFMSPGWGFAHHKLGPVRWSGAYSETGISQPWFQIESHPLFECLRAHIPDSAAWESFDQLKRKIQEVLEMTLAIEINERGEDTLTTSRNLRGRVFREFEATLSPEQLDWVPPETYVDPLIRECSPLVNTAKSRLALAVSRRVFPGMP